MPLYEYQCKKCRHRFEKIQKFSDPLVKTCPRCGGKVEQLLSPPAVRFKGSGWYVTDYARKSAPAGDGSSTESGEKKASEKPHTAAKTEPASHKSKKSHSKD